MDINKIVKKLSNKSWLAIDLEDLSEYVDPGFSRGEEGKRDTYKLAYALKSRWTLVPIKNGLYLVSERPEIFDETERLRMVEDAYWKIAKKLVSKNCGSGYVLAGPKSLEIRMRDFSIPNTLIVYTKNYDATLLVTDRNRIVFKTAKTGSKTGRTNAFPVFAKFSETFVVEGIKWKVASVEQALLDSLTVHKGVSEIDEYAVSKFLSKYAKSVDRDRLGRLVSCKYLTAVNRLREISRNKGFTSVYEKALDVVKREGGNCFITGTEN